MWGRPPRTLLGRYRTNDGEERENLLLVSEYWGLARHFHYVPELLLALCWALPAGGANFVPYFYFVFLSVLLFDRAGRGALRALPGLLRHRALDPDGDLGPGHREPLPEDERALPRPHPPRARCRADLPRRERWLLGSVRYESELHNHTVVHWDDSVLGRDGAHALETRSNYVEQYGARPDNYAITYIMHNQQPWAQRSDKPCLVTYNPVHPIDPRKVVARHWFQHVVHDVFHVSVLMNAFQFVQGHAHTWHCGAHTVVNSQEHGLISGLAVARQLGAGYAFEDAGAREWFNFWGRGMFGPRFREVREGERAPVHPASESLGSAASAGAG